MDREKRFMQKQNIKLRIKWRIYEHECFMCGVWGPRYAELRLKNFWRPWADPDRMSEHHKAWNKIMHIRPARRADATMAHLALRGRDTDSMIWSHPRRPHVYYW